MDHKGWTPENWCFWIVVLEKTPESPLDWKEIKPVNPEGNQSWIFIGKTYAEVQYLGHLIWKTDSLERPWYWERLMAEGGGGSGAWRMRWLDSITNSTDMNFSKLGDSEEQGSLVWCSPWGYRVWHDLVIER